MDVITLLLALVFNVPECRYEDGSTQDVCVWDDGSGDTVINLDHGRYWITLDGE